MYEPDNGKPIDLKKKTDVKILYDDQAIYVSAMLYDDEPSKILKEITERDDFGTSDFFGIYINGYNDGQQDFSFFCHSRGWSGRIVWRPSKWVKIILGMPFGKAKLKLQNLAGQLK